MKRVLVTGRIGSGKSEVCRYLAAKGWPVYDCDSRCKQLYDKVPGLKERIERELDIPFGELGRIFTDKVLLDKLEAIVFPLLLDDLKNWLRSERRSELSFIESATAPEKKAFDNMYDEVLMIQAPFETRAKRSSKAAERDALQTYGNAMATHVIDNTGTIEELHIKIDELYENKSS